MDVGSRFSLFYFYFSFLKKNGKMVIKSKWKRLYDRYFSIFVLVLNIYSLLWWAKKAGWFPRGVGDVVYDLLYEDDAP